MNITVVEVCNAVIALSAFVGAVAVLVRVVRGAKVATVDATIDKKINEKINPLALSLQSIDENYKALAEEMTLLMQLNVALVDELKEGQIDGKTTKAIDELNAYLIKQANR
jgi:hypothetical protein